MCAPGKETPKTAGQQQHPSTPTPVCHAPLYPPPPPHHTPGGAARCTHVQKGPVVASAAITAATTHTNAAAGPTQVNAPGSARKATPPISSGTPMWRWRSPLASLLAPRARAAAAALPKGMALHRTAASWLAAVPQWRGGEVVPGGGGGGGAAARVTLAEGSANACTRVGTPWAAATGRGREWGGGGGQAGGEGCVWRLSLQGTQVVKQGPPELGDSAHAASG